MKISQATAEIQRLRKEVKKLTLALDKKTATDFLVQGHMLDQANRNLLRKIQNTDPNAWPEARISNFSLNEYSWLRNWEHTDNTKLLVSYVRDLAKKQRYFDHLQIGKFMLIIHADDIDAISIAIGRGQDPDPSFILDRDWMLYTDYGRPNESLRRTIPRSKDVTNLLAKANVFLAWKCDPCCEKRSKLITLSEEVNNCPGCGLSI